MFDTTQDAGDLPASDGKGLGDLPALILAYAERGRRAPELVPLSTGKVILGRGATLFAGGPLQDSRMSREHAVLSSQRGQHQITDSGSRNGTWVRGQRLAAPHPLLPGDLLRLGDTLLLFARCPARGGPDLLGMVGVSTAMAQLRRSIAAVAADASSVLVQGETGTGKELIARALHEHSGRKGPLVPVNCGAIAEGVLASELFGHTRGAFTGATEARDGLFRAAHGGTLFLDEVGEMPLSLQVQLLRALESRQIRPVGASRDVPVDVRVVAATNRDLPEAVRAGAFRADLYARLAQWQIASIPLRERREDIPFLAAAFLAQRGPDVAARGMTLELAEALLLHPHPFNARSLRNLLTTAELASPREAPLGLAPEVERALAAERTLAAPRPSSAETATAAMPPREVIEATLVRAGGKVAEAARQLGASRQQLYRWLDAHGIDIEAFRR